MATHTVCMSASVFLCKKKKKSVGHKAKNCNACPCRCGVKSGQSRLIELLFISTEFTFQKKLKVIKSWDKILLKSNVQCLTFLEIGFFHWCDRSLIQKFTFAWQILKHGSIYILLYTWCNGRWHLFVFAVPTRHMCDSVTVKYSVWQASRLHLAGFWVWSSSWGGLTMRLPWTHF